jgi:hypothetical protein
MQWYEALALSLVIWVAVAVVLALMVGRVVSANQRAGRMR